MATLTVGEIVKCPMPVFAVALKNFTAVGAGHAAGTPSAVLLMLLPGFVYVPAPLTADATPVIVDVEDPEGKV